MCAALDDAAFGEVQDEIGILCRAQIMGDQQGGAAETQAIERCGDFPFIPVVKSGRRFVKNQDGGSPNGSPSNRDPLSLPTR